jgi:Transglycosylase SLT domain
MLTLKRLCVGLIAVTSFATNAIAQEATYSKTLLADAEIKTAVGYKYVVKEANIVFPNALKGNEEYAIEYIEKFAKNRRDYLIRTYKKSKKFFPKVTNIFRKHRLATEYQVLLPLESGFNGNAVSGAGAVGYWQIMDFVAKEYGLNYEPQLSAEEKKKLAAEEEAKKTAVVLPGTVIAETKKVEIVDDRKNFIKSTNTAAKYLRDRARNLNNNMLLMVASYNCGVGNVWEAKRKSGMANPTFWDVKKFLPAETQAYVMNFITLNVLFNNYNKFANNTLTFLPSVEKVKVITKKEMVEGIVATEAEDNVDLDF